MWLLNGFTFMKCTMGFVGLVLRTFSSVFPFVEVWDTAHGDIVMLGSLQPWPSGPEAFAKSFALEGVRSDLAVIGIHSPEALWARQVDRNVSRTRHCRRRPDPA